MSPTLKVLSLGAGVQSTALALMAAVGVLERPDIAIFADTGWEPKHVYTHLEWLIKELPYEVRIVKQGNLRDDLIASAQNNARIAQPPAFLRHPDGTKGQIRRACTHEYKVRPLEREIRQLLGIKPRTRKFERTAERWYGISIDEAHRMRDSGQPFVVNRYPLIDLGMSRQDCLNWMQTHGYPVPPKSACIGCPYHNDRYWRMLRDKYPDEWLDAVAMDEMIRHGIRGVKLPAYLHASLVPLDQVDLRTLRERGQDTFPWHGEEDGFGNECEGMCGV